MPALSAHVPRALHEAAINVLAPRATIGTSWTEREDRFQQAHDTVSGGIIAVIVVACLFGLGVTIGGCCMYGRAQARRQERAALQQKPPTYNSTQPTGTVANVSVPPPAYAPSSSYPGMTDTSGGGYDGFSSGGGGGISSTGGGFSDSGGTSSGGGGFSSSGGGGGGGTSSGA
jgi:hypothetical protein